MTTVSVDLGGTNVKSALIKDGVIVESFSAPSRSDAGIRETLSAVEHVIMDWKNKSDIDGIGVAFPGIVDPAKKKVVSREGKFEDAWLFDFEGWARERFDLPLILENDALAAAAGEHAFGAAKGCGDFVLLILGTGIGASAFMDGKPVRGKHNQAGITMGHVPRGGDRPCACCGGVGCSESRASTWALGYMIAESPIDSPLKNETTPDFKLLKRYCEEGDALAVSLFEECVSVWVDVILSLVYAYDPELVVLSGGVLKWGNELFDRIKKGVLEKAWTEWGALRFAAASDPDASVVLGLHELAK
ncbi:MAG: ROK family protein [Clostridia bacterium]|nr:ROK family protein [Clostridia bacterium]